MKGVTFLFVAQLPIQVINFQLQGSGVLMRKVVLTSRLASTSLGCMHTDLPVPSSLKVDEMVFTLGPHRFCMVWT